MSDAEMRERLTLAERQLQASTSMSDAQTLAVARAILATDDSTCIVRAKIVAELTALLAERA